MTRPAFPGDDRRTEAPEATPPSAQEPKGRGRFGRRGARRPKAAPPEPSADATRAPLALEAGDKPSRFARYKAGEDGLNKTERAYRDHLEEQKRSGLVWDYLVHAANFRIGEKCFYRPDFMVYMPDGSLEVHETKGFMEDKALVKIRAFQAKFHIPLVLVKRQRGGWQFRRYEPAS